MRAATVVVAWLLCLAGPAEAARKTVVIGAGDCGDPGLRSAVSDFQTLAGPLLGADLLEPDTVLRAVRPRASRGVPELERQVEAARALLYSGESERGLDMVQDALRELERASPLAGPGPVLVQALLLEAQMLKNLDRGRESAEAHRRVLRVDPGFGLDADQFPPSTLAAFDAVRRELARGRRGSLVVDVVSGPPASVFLDGREVGPTGKALDLPVGSYRVELVQGDRVSFAHRVTLGRAERLQVDLAFEGSVATRPPLCAGDDRAAQRLAGLVAAQRVVVVKDGASAGNPPYWLGTLYEVRTSERIRNGGVRPGQLEDLMTYLFTGKPELGEAPSPTPEPPPAPLGAPVAEASPPAGGLLPPSPAPPGPVLAEAPRPPATSSRVPSIAALAAGGALAATGVILWATWGAEARGRHAALSPGGRLPDPASAPRAWVASLDAMAAADTSLAVSLTLVGAGLGAAVGGLLGLTLFPPGTTVSVTPWVQGGLLAVRLEL